LSKTPNLVQRQTGVYKYPTLVLPPMVTLHKQTTNPALPSRINQNTPAAPVVGNPAPAMNPAPGLTNRPGYPVK
jgi:hypothetical protein